MQHSLKQLCTITYFIELQQELQKLVQQRVLHVQKVYKHKVVQSLCKKDMCTVYIIQPQTVVGQQFPPHENYELRQENCYLKHEVSVPVKQSSLLYLPPQLHSVAVLLTYVARRYEV